ncbi:hypothetical protein SE23_01660 [Vibrio sinaloensis]|uniref:hypothetical protein n=1 Tax=Photobacterium sp. (strain ATCC 43367) TaxID=379097 RepID=UPI00057D0942|nr:hypothetical protein [Vibrio sinaloensis]KIE22224.1 hypothetical protein SE23_01660 [Vibrio sinaloensis]
MRILVLWLGLLSCHASATTLLLTTPIQEFVFDVQSSWVQCEEQVWCQDVLTYYRHDYYGQAERIHEQWVLELFSEYSNHRFSDLQLNLRSDGFSLIHVDIAGEQFDVIQQLTVKGAEEADKALIEFINAFPAAQPRVLTWQSRLWKAKLVSDGELISLSLVPR